MSLRQSPMAPKIAQQARFDQWNFHYILFEALEQQFNPEASKITEKRRRKNTF